MLRIRSWALAQRVVLVIALAVALALLGRYLVSLGRPHSYGWFAYAPVNSRLSPPPPGMRAWARLLIWLGMVAVWALASCWVLRPAKDRRPPAA